MKKNLFFLFLFGASLVAVVARVSYLYQIPKTAGLKKDVIVMDRHTLSHSLVSIFGEKSKPVVLQSIFNVGAPIGGGCDYYSMNFDDKQNLIDPFTRCPSLLRDINASIFMKMNPLRTAAVNQACRNLTKDDEMVSHALKMSQLKVSDPPDLANIKKLHFTFHKSPMEEGQEEIYKNSVSPQPPKPTWAMVVYSACVSPTWQTL